MFTGTHNAGLMRRAALLAAIALACVPAAWGFHSQHSSPPAHAAPAPKYSAPAKSAQNKPNNSNNSTKPPSQAGPQYQTRPQGNPMQRPAPNYATPRPAYPGAPYGTPARPAYSNPGYAPPGHLGDWLNQHRGQPVQDQERMLRSDPNFNRLPPADQQRLVQQLHSVDQMPEDQRQRRLARAEALEHMSPQDRMRLNMSGQRLAGLAPDRQTLVKNAFRDLRGVPLDQRQMVLNSSRYQGVFTPEERGILSDFLRAEPYEPAR
jgi:Protein of unknown function (DUF3106)